MSRCADSVSRPAGRGLGGVYQPQLDGLRAVAVMGVLFHHFGLHIPEFFEYGPISVRLFFALTGYFITIWLWRADDAAKAAGVGVWRELAVFHARRLLRIVPPLYLSLAIAAVLGLEVVRRDLPWHMFFASNFYVCHVGYWPLTVSHLWSLSVQEQFYLLWPVVVLLTPRRWFPRVLVAAILTAFLFRLGCVLWDVNPVIRWTMLFGSLDSFATGGLIAWWSQGRVGAQLMSRRQRWGWGVAALAALVLARVLRHLPQSDPWVASIDLFEAVFLGWLLAATAQGWPGVVGWVLSRPPLVYIGQISLGIYLYHVLINILVGPRLDAIGVGWASHNLMHVLILSALSVGAASLSWHLMEKPLARLKPRVQRAGGR
jgi:peptidoglycan/LPS O-acetylase OafA/YrhL